MADQLKVEVFYRVDGTIQADPQVHNINDQGEAGLDEADRRAVTNAVNRTKGTYWDPEKKEFTKKVEIIRIEVDGKSANSVGGLFPAKKADKPEKPEKKAENKAEKPAEKKADRPAPKQGGAAGAKPAKAAKSTGGPVKGTGTATPKTPAQAKTVDTSKAKETGETHEVSEDSSSDRVFKGTISYETEGKSALKKGVSKNSDGDYVDESGNKVKNAFTGGGKKTETVDFQYVRDPKDGDGLTEERAENIVNLVESKLPEDFEGDPNDVKVQLHPDDMPASYEGNEISLSDLKSFADGDLWDPDLKAEEDEHPFGKLGEDVPYRGLTDLLTTDVSQIEHSKEKWEQFLQFIMILIAGGNVDMIKTALSILARIYGMDTAKEMLQLADTSKKLMRQKDKINEKMADLMKASDKKSAKAGELRAKKIELESQLENVQTNIRMLFERLREAKTEKDNMEQMLSGYSQTDNRHRRSLAPGALS